MSAVEIENTMLKHADVQECAVIGAPDAKVRLHRRAALIPIFDQPDYLRLLRRAFGRSCDVGGV